MTYFHYFPRLVDVLININGYANKIIILRSMLLANVSNGITGTKAMCHNNVLGLKYLGSECFSFIIDILLMFHEYALDLLH